MPKNILLIFICIQCLVHFAAVSNNNQPTLMNSSCHDIVFQLWQCLSENFHVFEKEVQVGMQKMNLQ